MEVNIILKGDAKTTCGDDLFGNLFGKYIY